MIKSLTTHDPYLVVHGGYHNYPYISPGTHSAGYLRWNTNTNLMEVNDGVSWRNLAANDTSISLSETAKQALNWAISKMQQEQELQQRMQRHPGLRDAWDKFRIMEALCREEDARQLNS